jgi:hypothetical protein
MRSLGQSRTNAVARNLTQALALAGDISDSKLLGPYYDCTLGCGRFRSAVSIIPDYIGYGASLKRTTRTYAYPPTY